jgi:hypothetical protein
MAFEGVPKRSDLAQSARFKPTAFEAVSFELVCNRMAAWLNIGGVRMLSMMSSTT